MSNPYPAQFDFILPTAIVCTWHCSRVLLNILYCFELLMLHYIVVQLFVWDIKEQYCDIFVSQIYVDKINVINR